MSKILIDEATVKLVLEALKQIDDAMPFPVAKLAQAALREALAEQPAQQKQHMSELTKVEEAILGYWGERCSTFESECPVCQAWVEFEIKTALGPNCYPPLKPLPKEKL